MTAQPPLSSLMQIAEQRGHQTGRAQSDLASALFPASDFPPDEMTVATTRARMKAWVDGLEADLLAHIDGCDSAEGGLAWQILCAGRLLDDPLFIETAWSEASFERLHRRAWALRQLPGVPPLLGALASANDPLQSAAALRLLTAEAAAWNGAAHGQLAAESLHLLCWRTVASLEVAGAAPIEKLVAAGEHVIAAHREAETRPSAAMRLAHLIDANDEAARDPEQAGLSLFLAMLSRTTRIDFGSLCRIAVEPDQARMCIAMRAAGLSPPVISQHVVWLSGPTSTAHVAPDTLAAIDPEAARTLCLRWATQARAPVGNVA